MIDYVNYFTVAIAAMSGGLLAARKEMDFLAFIVLGVVTGLGGGTLRDAVLDVPVFWVENQNNLLVAIAASLLAYAIARREMNGWRRRGIIWLDALAMAFFAASGTMKALGLDTAPIVAITMGLLTAVAGGLMRDVIAQEIPFILRGEIFAFAAIGGACAVVLMTYLGLTGLPVLVVGIAVAFTIRALAIIYNLQLHVAKRVDD